MTVQQVGIVEWGAVASLKHQIFFPRSCDLLVDSDERSYEHVRKGKGTPAAFGLW